MKPGTYDFTIYQGSTFHRIFTLRDKDGGTIDLTDFEVRMAIRNEIDSEIIASYDSASDTELSIDILNGQITLNIPDVETETLDFRYGLYDLEIYSDEVVYRIMQGNVTLSKEITRVDD